VWSWSMRWTCRVEVSVDGMQSSTLRATRLTVQVATHRTQTPKAESISQSTVPRRSRRYSGWRQVACTRLGPHTGHLRCMERRLAACFGNCLTHASAHSNIFARVSRAYLCSERFPRDVWLMCRVCADTPYMCRCVCYKLAPETFHHHDHETMLAFPLEIHRKPSFKDSALIKYSSRRKNLVHI